VYKAVYSVISKILKEEIYKQENTSEWISRICDDVISSLKKLNSNFKFIVNCIITEKASLEIQSSCYYSPFDTNILVKWENSYMSVIVNIFTVAL
jgi:dynein light chain Tctex-type 1